MMPLVLFATVAALSLVNPAGAQPNCCGDCDGDGEVSIGNLITAVNNALNGCSGTALTPTPTPPPAASCPVDFADDNTDPSTPACFYLGRWNETCGDDRLGTIWVSDGATLLVLFTDFADIDCGGPVVSATSATLVGCFLGPNDTDFVAVDGTIILGPQGATLTLAPTESPFNVEDCPVQLYQGTLSEVIGPTPTVQRRSLPDSLVRLQRLRKAFLEKPSRRNLQRH